MPTLHQAIDLTSYAATAKGALASPTAFIAGLRPSYTTVAGLAVLGAPAT